MTETSCEPARWEIPSTGTVETLDFVARYKEQLVIPRPQGEACDHDVSEEPSKLEPSDISQSRYRYDPLGVPDRCDGIVGCQWADEQFTSGNAPDAHGRPPLRTHSGTRASSRSTSSSTIYRTVLIITLSIS